MILPSFILSASSKGILRPRAISFVISVEPIGKISREIGKSFSKTTTDSVSEPILAKTHPAIFWAFVRVTYPAAIGEAITSITSIPASSTASTRSL